MPVQRVPTPFLDKRLVEAHVAPKGQDDYRF